MDCSGKATRLRSGLRAPKINQRLMFEIVLMRRCEKINPKLSFGRERAKLGCTLRGGERPGGVLLDAPGGGGRLLAAAPAEAPQGRSGRARAPGCLPPRSLPTRRTRGARLRLALVGPRWRLLAPDGPRASRPVRCASGARPPHAPCCLEAPATDGARRCAPSLRRPD
jgi:hypothetical protein